MECIDISIIQCPVQLDKDCIPALLPDHFFSMKFTAGDKIDILPTCNSTLNMFNVHLCGFKFAPRMQYNIFFQVFKIAEEKAFNRPIKYKLFYRY